MTLIWPLRPQAATPFKHVIIVFQENRTPDNLFGSSPHFERGVDIASSGVNSKGVTIPLTAEPLDGCYDIAHSHPEFEHMLTEGADREAVQAAAGCAIPRDPQFKFADNSTGTMQPYFDIATNYGFANRMFQTNQGPSLPAHQFIFGGTSQPSAESDLFVAENPRIKNVNSGCIAPANQTVVLIDGYGNENTNEPIYPCFEHATLSDLLDQAHIPWRWYSPTPGSIWTAPDSINHICMPVVVGDTLECQGPAWTNGSVVPNNPAQVLTDIQACNLAAVSWVIPTGDESDHASINNGTGPQWVASVVNTLGQQPACASGETYWTDTAILIAWDDWGGWYDHVTPVSINQQPNSPAAWGDGYTCGFRVPLMVVSAYTPSGYVDEHVHDFGSILYFIEKTFKLGFIGPGEGIYGNYADYQAAARHDQLATFFTLTTPRPFVPIATTLKASYFQHLPPSSKPPDDD